MAFSVFPRLPLEEWRASRDTVRLYAQVLSAVRQSLTPPQKHWWHISLRAAATGLTTTPIPAGDMTFEMLLDLATHELSISTSEGDWWDMSLRGQSVQAFAEEVRAALQALGIDVELDDPAFADSARRAYDSAAIEDYWRAASQIDILFKQFKGTLREETSPVQLFPHHFDFSFVWFSGNLVPGVDQEDREKADEQITYGFSTGNSVIAQPYFYATAYPWRESLLHAPLPDGATWNTNGWKGARLPYDTVIAAAEPKARLLEFLQAAHRAGSGLMKQHQVA